MENYCIGNGTPWSGVAFIPDEYVERIIKALTPRGIVGDDLIEEYRSEVQKILDEAFSCGVHFGPLWGSARPFVSVSRSSVPTKLDVSFWYHAQHNASGREKFAIAPESQRPGRNV